MTKQKSVTVGWFEIPVTEMNRAIRFYETVFDTTHFKTTVWGCPDGVVSLE